MRIRAADMDELLATVRAALIDEGASPATADMLAVDFVERARVKVERDKADNDAQRLLPLGWRTVTERLGVCKSSVYKMAKRARQSTFRPSSVDKAGLG